MKAWFTQFKRHPVFKGAPFIIFLGVGVYVLQEFEDLRHIFLARQQVKVNDDQAERIRTSRILSLEEEFERIKGKATKDYEMVRIERPWEKKEVN